MREDIHPKYQALKIIIGKDEFMTASTMTGGELLMDIDYRKHPAWNKAAVNIVNQSNKSVSDFNKKFAGLSFGIKQ